MAGYDDENITAGCQRMARSLSRWSVSGKGTSGRNARYSGRVQALRYVQGHGPRGHLVAISCQGDGKSGAVRAGTVTVIEALRWFIRHPDVLQYLASLLLQIVHEQRIEVNRRKVSCGNVPRDTMLVMHSRAYGTECSGSMRPGNVPSGCLRYPDGENTALLNFTQERGFFAQGAVTVTRSTTS